MDVISIAMVYFCKVFFVSLLGKLMHCRRQNFEEFALATFFLVSPHNVQHVDMVKRAQSRLTPHSRESALRITAKEKQNKVNNHDVIIISVHRIHELLMMVKESS